MKYKPYPSYKDSGVEWLGQLPEGWDTVKLKHVVEASRPITYGIVQAGANKDDGIPYIRPADMSEENGVIDPEAILRTTNEIASNYARSMIKTGDIICSIGPSFGKVMITPDWLNGGNLTQGTARVAIGSSHNTRYYFWTLRSLTSFAQWEASVGGATFRALNLGPLANTSAFRPTKLEQTAIATFLDRETAKLDTLITKQEKLIELLQEKRHAVISHAVTKGLDSNVKMKDSGLEWLGLVPEHWNRTAIKHVVSMPITDGPHETPTFYDEGIPFVSAEAVSAGWIDFNKVRGYISKEDHEKYSKKYHPRIGDVYMVKSGATTGITAIVDTDIEFNIWSPLAVVRCGEKMLPRFALLFMRSQNFLEAVSLNWSFGTQQNIGMGVIENIAITIPPIDEQTLIVDFIDSETTKIDTLIEKSKKSIELAKEHRTALISAAVTGKIDVRDVK